MTARHSIGQVLIAWIVQMVDMTRGN